MTVNDLFSKIYRSSIKEFRRNMKSAISYVIKDPDVSVAIHRYNRPLVLIVNPDFMHGIATEVGRLMRENDELYDEIARLKGEELDAAEVSH